MIIRSIKESPNEENPHKVEVRKLYDHKNAQVMHLVLLPGQSLKPHFTPVDVFFNVLEGSPEFRVGDEKETVEKDNLIESPKNVVHCISNQSGSVAHILVVKAPKQMDKSVLL